MENTVRQNLGAPTVAQPVRVDRFPGPAMGHRLILDGYEGHVRDHRAASNVISDPMLGDYVHVVTEGQWYAWLREGRPGKMPHPAAPWPVEMVYVEL